MKRYRRFFAALLVAVAIACTSAAAAAQPPTGAAQDEFVPVSRAAQQETIPAARLVMIAYGFAWVMLIGYLWSIWTRIGKVERELHDVSRRLKTGDR
jgi:CcmD family protein